MARLGLWALFFKLSLKFFPWLLKLLKGVKTIKVGLAAGSFTVWGLFFNWQFVVVLMAMIFIHESGHVWAMKKMGMKTKGFYFVPLLGGAAIPDDAFPSRGAESYVAIMGPIWGGVMAIPFLAAWYMTQNPIWAGTASWIAMVNLFNLLPILPLDGGRMIRAIAFSFSRRTGLVLTSLGLLAGVIISWKLGLSLFIFLFILGGIEVIAEAKGGTRAAKLREKFKKLTTVFGEFSETEILAGELSEQSKQERGNAIKLFEEEVMKGTRSRRELRIVKKLVYSLPEDPSYVLTEKLLPKNVDTICENLRREIFEIGDCCPIPHGQKTEYEDELHKQFLVKDVHNFLNPEFAMFYGKRRSYAMFINPMNIWQTVYSVFSYIIVAGLLYLTMYQVSHIPGASEALKIFMN